MDEIALAGGEDVVLGGETERFAGVSVEFVVVAWVGCEVDDSWHGGGGVDKAEREVFERCSTSDDSNGMKCEQASMFNARFDTVCDSGCDC